MESFYCDGLSKSFDGVAALVHVTLRLPVTGVTAIIGPNGAGKTTLLNILSGFIKPDSGRCYLGDQETTHMPSYQIARLGVARTFQDLRFVHQLTVFENVLLARPKQQGENLLGIFFSSHFQSEEVSNREEATRLLKLVELEKQAYDFAEHLSYGQQKLLTVASCLATEARVLLLDEPVAGVNPGTAAKIISLLRRLGGQGKAIVFVEHDIAAVREVADRLIVMDGGKIIADGVPHEILERPEIMEAYVT